MQDKAAPHSDRMRKLHWVQGVSFIPDPVVDGDNEELINKIQDEFLDFLHSVRQIIRMLLLLKLKHLRSVVPISHDVYREMQKTERKGYLFKKFDRYTSGFIPGLTSSTENILKPRPSTGNIAGLVGCYRRKSTLVPGSAWGRAATRLKKDHKMPNLEMHLTEIIGKKTKPIWHQVALEKPPDEMSQKIKDSQVSATNTVDVKGPVWELIHEKHVPITRTVSQTLIKNIRLLVETKVKASTKAFEAQMDMLQAMDSGFRSVSEYKQYLETLKPHWFKDLLLNAAKVGIVRSQDVVNAFERLGELYYLHTNAVKMPKAKMCFLVMSMPVWDVCRLPMQRAIDFVLYDVFKVPSLDGKLLASWLAVRKLPYVVEPPVHSVILEEERHAAVLQQELQMMREEDEAKAQEKFTLSRNFLPPIE